jgi:2-phosphoglycerate kinase
VADPKVSRAALCRPDERDRVSTKPILLLGGAPGTGKSTLAGRLSAHLEMDHRIGTGFIRAVVQSEVSPDEDPDLFSMTFQADDPVAHLEKQALRLRNAVLACVERARREGTSLVVEGSHLIPSLYAGLEMDGFVVLGAPRPGEHLSRLLGPSHANRRISEHDLSRIRSLDLYYRSEAARLGVPVLVYEDLDPVLALLGVETPG